MIEIQKQRTSVPILYTHNKNIDTPENSGLVAQEKTEEEGVRFHAGDTQKRLEVEAREEEYRRKCEV